MKILYIVLITVTLNSCNVGTYGNLQNESIPIELRVEIEKLDKKVIDGIVTNSPSKIKDLLSDKLIEKSGSDISKYIEQVNSIVKSSDYIILDQYYVNNSTTGIGNTVFSGVDGMNDYKLKYHALNKEMFISLLIVGDEMDKILITNIYGKYPNGWKLNILQFGQYIVNNKTATELYSQAKQEYEDKYLVDATNNMFLSSNVSNPGNGYITYNNAKEMEDFYAKLLAEIKEEYNFPITINEIKSKPRIINISPQGMEEGYFPMVNYVTSIDLADTLKTRIENDKIDDYIDDYFVGLTKNKKYVFYKAFSSMPDGKTEIPTYGFIKESE